jgi:hypothetical protein
VRPSGITAAAIPPGPPGTGAMVNRAYVPFPTGMTSTTDSKVCAQHAGIAGGLGCSAGLPKGMLALVWDCPQCKVDGYRLFRVDGGRREPVAIPPNGADFTAALLAPPKADHPGAVSVGTAAAAPHTGFWCYAVLAYRGANESELSNGYCVGNASVINMKTETFAPDHVRSSIGTTSNVFLQYSSTGGLKVGATHATIKSASGDSSMNTIARGGLHFDLGTLSKTHIFSAKLHVPVSRTDFDASTVRFDHTTSCASAIDIGTEPWWNHADWIETSKQKFPFDTTARLQPGSATGPNATYDVTPIVSDWAAQTTENFGLVLMTDDQGIQSFTEGGCQTSYTGNVTLEVKYWQ